MVLADGLVLAGWKERGKCPYHLTLELTPGGQET